MVTNTTIIHQPNPLFTFTFFDNPNTRTHIYMYKDNNNY